ncbi:MAG: hypothetical protein ACM3UL_03595 [Ignavibacteria bacterium]
MNIQNINWFALVGGVLTLLVIPVSYISPWWRLSIGQNLIDVNASPVHSVFTFLNTQFTAPLLWALNLSVILFLLVAGIVMLTYSVLATKPYARDLLDFAYKKPLYLIVFFLAGILIVIAILTSFLQLDIPIIGPANITLPSNFTGEAQISVAVNAGFGLAFWLAIAASIMCIIARIYHTRITQQSVPITT